MVQLQLGRPQVASMEVIRDQEGLDLLDVRHSLLVFLVQGQDVVALLDVVRVSLVGGNTLEMTVVLALLVEL